MTVVSVCQPNVLGKIKCVFLDALVGVLVHKLSIAKACAAACRGARVIVGLTYFQQRRRWWWSCSVPRTVLAFASSTTPLSCHSKIIRTSYPVSTTYPSSPIRPTPPNGPLNPVVPNLFKLADHFVNLLQTRGPPLNFYRKNFDENLFYFSGFLAVVINLLLLSSSSLSLLLL